MTTKNSTVEMPQYKIDDVVWKFEKTKYTAETQWSSATMGSIKKDVPFYSISGPFVIRSISIEKNKENALEYYYDLGVTKRVHQNDIFKSVTDINIHIKKLEDTKVKVQQN